MKKGVVNKLFFNGAILILFLLISSLSVDAATRTCYSCGNCTNEIANSSSEDIIQLNNSLNTTSNCINAGNKSNFVLNCINFSNYLIGDSSGVDWGINLTSSANVTIQNCNVSRFHRGLSLYYSRNITINNSLIDVNHFGVYLDNSSYNQIENISGSYSYAATFHLTQLMKDNSWKEIYAHRFNTLYSTQKFGFDKINGKVVLRIVQRELPFGDVEQIKLDSCFGEISPEYARYVDNGKNIIDEIKKIDNNVIVAHDREIEISWKIPFFCIGKQIVSLTANEYSHSYPFRFPEGTGFVDYSSSKGKIKMDGLISKEDNLENYLFNPHWIPDTGHPNGNTYLYTKEDETNIYFSIDVTMDNTDDFGEDWTKILIRTTKGEKEFRIDDYNNKYGLCGFGFTDKVSYRHQTCEFKIPKKEIGSDKFGFAFYYYGTGGQTGGAGLYLTGGSNLNIVKNSNFSWNNNVGVRLVGGNYNNFTNIIASSNDGHTAGLISFGFFVGTVKNENNTFDNITSNDNYDGLGMILGFANDSIIKNSNFKDNPSRAIEISTDTYRVNLINLTMINCSTSGGTALGIYGNIRGDNITITNSTVGISFLLNSGNSTVSNLVLRNNSQGIIFSSVRGIIITNLTLQSSSQYGLFFTGSSINNTVRNSFIQLNGGSALSLNNSDLGSSPLSNNFYNNYFNNSISYSNFSTSLTNFFNTTKTLGQNIAGGNYTGGNYWAAPNGSGYSQTCISSADGICDTSYNLDGVNYDYLPLTCTESWSCGDWGTCNDGIQIRSCIDANLCQTYHFKPAESQNCQTQLIAVPQQKGGGSSFSSTIPKILPQQPVEITINNSDMDLNSLVLTVKKEVQNSSVNITKLDPLTYDSITGLPIGRLYQVFEIEPGIDNSNILNATLNFRINKTWLNQNNITFHFKGDRFWLIENDVVGNIKIYRNPDGGSVWMPLTTSYSYQDNQSYHFYAYSKGFSTFAIFLNKYDCLPNSARCEDSKVQLCLGNSTWLVTERCAYGCGDRKCASSFFKSKQFKFLSIVIIVAVVLIALILLFYGKKNKIKRKERKEIRKRKREARKEKRKIKRLTRKNKRRGRRKK